LQDLNQRLSTALARLQRTEIAVSAFNDTQSSLNKVIYPHRVAFTLQNPEPSK